MSDLTKILAENQKERPKFLAPSNKKQPVSSNIQDSDSEPENIFVARTSTPMKTYTATSSKTTPNSSRNMVTGVHNDSRNQPTKRSKQQRTHSEQQKDRPTTSKILFAPQLQTFPSANLLPMPKALTASLPVFDGKSEKFELFETYSEKISKCTLISRKFKNILRTYSEILLKSTLFSGKFKK